ncbi:MAG: sulfatase-like hydrolase/transferase [Bacteroidales bacterium]|nr:sulfatase-like hydrolase/transferase [Bacteroidales bacterium]
MQRLRQNHYILFLYRLLLVMAIFSGCRIIFFFINKDFYPDMDLSRFLRIVGGGLQFDLTAMIYTNLLFIVVSLLPFRFIYKKAVQLPLKIIFVSTNGIAMAANIADMAYFRFTMRRTTFSFFQEFGHDNNMGDVLWASISDYWYLWLLWIAVLAVLWFGYGRFKVQGSRFKVQNLIDNNQLLYYTLRIIIFVVGIALCVAGVRGGFHTSTRPITLSNAAKYVTHQNETAIVLNTPFCIYRTLSRKDFKPLHYFDEESLAAIYTPMHTPEPTEAFRTDNVVVFIVESLARFHIGAMNRELPELVSYTPFLDSLMQHSHAFCNAFANGHKSIDAIPSVLGSIPTLEQPYVLTPYALNEVNGLGTLLREKGYHTAFFHGAQNNSMGFSSIVKMLGFEQYYGRSEYNNDKDFDGIWGIWDEPFLQFYAQQLNTFPQPFAAAVFTTSSHHPFKVPKQYKDKFPKGPMPNNECVAYTDYALRRFFETASQMPWFKHTLFVITADHSSWCTYNSAYQNSLNSMAVPIIYYHPGIEQAIMDSTITNQIDILPTILGYLNYELPYIAFGKDRRKEGESFVFNYSNGYQLLYNGYLLLFDGEKAIGFYRWENRGFNGLGENLCHQLPEQQEKSEQLLKALLQQYNNRMIENKLRVENEQLKI